MGRQCSQHGFENPCRRSGATRTAYSGNNMKIAITGATGFIGSELTRMLVARGDEVVRLVRSAPSVASSGQVFDLHWNPPAGDLDVDAFSGVDAVIHLAGAGIADARWTAARRQLILESRTVTTKLLVKTMVAMDRPPPLFLSGSAVGFYGNTGDAICSESSGPGNDFPAEICGQWERAAEPAAEAGITTTLLRTGIVLGRSGGVLRKLLLPFRLGLGGRIGKGQQWMSWISLRDECRAVMHLLDHPVSGPVNLVSPNPVTNTQFTQALGRALRRPTLIPTPVGALKARYGAALVDSILLGGQRVEPRVLPGTGFEFEDQWLGHCLSNLLRAGS